MKLPTTRLKFHVVVLWLFLHSEILPWQASDGKTQKFITKHWWDIWCIFKLQECKKRGLKVVVAGIPKTIDNDIEVSGTHFCTL